MIVFDRIFRKIKRYFYVKRNKFPIKTIDPERLSQKMQDNSYSKKYHKFRNKYYWIDIKEQGMFDKKGRKVKVWRLIKSAYDVGEDVYIPIYYKR